jgi:hypothetical protein
MRWFRQEAERMVHETKALDVGELRQWFVAALVVFYDKRPGSCV